MSKNRIFIASFLAILCLAAPAAGLTAPTPALPEPQRMRIDVTHLVEPETASHDGGLPPGDASGGIGPGSRLFIHIGSGRYLCSANFLWTDGPKTYLGAAGHCFMSAGKKSTHGSDADWDASAVKVYVCTRTCVTGGYTSGVVPGGYTLLGPVVYARQSGPLGDVGSDFGLVEVPSTLNHLLRPGLPVFGGPHAYVAPGYGDTVCQFGNGVVYGETFLTQARVGVSAGTAGGGRSFTYYGASGGGDSGSAVVNCMADETGFRAISAVGILTHAIQVPEVGMGLGITYGTTVPRAITMAQEAGLNISLVTG